MINIYSTNKHNWERNELTCSGKQEVVLNDENNGNARLLVGCIQVVNGNTVTTLNFIALVAYQVDMVLLKGQTGFRWWLKEKSSVRSFRRSDKVHLQSTAKASLLCLFSQR